MTPPGQEPIRMRLVEVTPPESFTDEMDAGDFVVRTMHRLQPAAGNQLGLARQAGADVKMTSEVLRKLEAKGLVRRAVDAGDTRARRVRVTDRGATLARSAVEAVEAVDARFFRATPDRAALVAMLRPLAGRAPADIPGA